LLAGRRHLPIIGNAMSNPKAGYRLAQVPRRC
jgi:hypothetical protein